MNRSQFRNGLAVFALTAALAALYGPARAEQDSQTVQQISSNGSSQELIVELMDPENKAKKRSATVEVDVKGIRIMDPDKEKEEPRRGIGHFQYRLDEGTVIASTSRKMSFHELTPGRHKIEVSVAGSDYEPLGLKGTLYIEIP